VNTKWVVRKGQVCLQDFLFAAWSAFKSHLSRYPLSLTRSGPSMWATSTSIDRFVWFDIKHLMPHCLCWNVSAKATIESDIWMTIAHKTVIKIFRLFRCKSNMIEVTFRKTFIRPFKARQNFLSEAEFLKRIRFVSSRVTGYLHLAWLTATTDCLKKELSKIHQNIISLRSSKF